MAHSGVRVVELEESVVSPTSSISLEGARAFTEQSTSPQPAMLDTEVTLEASSAEVQIHKCKQQHLNVGYKVKYVKAITAFVVRMLVPAVGPN